MESSGLVESAMEEEEHLPLLLSSCKPSINVFSGSIRLFATLPLLICGFSLHKFSIVKRSCI